MEEAKTRISRTSGVKKEIKRRNAKTNEDEASGQSVKRSRTKYGPDKEDENEVQPSIMDQIKMMMEEQRKALEQMIDNRMMGVNASSNNAWGAWGNDQAQAEGWGDNPANAELFYMSGDEDAIRQPANRRVY